MTADTPENKRPRTRMGQGKGIREVGYIDCAGGGQVTVKGGDKCDTKNDTCH